jgi:dihydrofolate synthase/folylpolyglutamate synthase
MPASVFAAIAGKGARAVVAGDDFSWQLGADSWDYQGLEHTFSALPPSALAGAIQFRNAATAFAAVEALTLDPAPTPGVRALAARLTAFDADTAARALRQVQLAGRFQIIPGPVEWILDIAHNEPAAHVLAQQLRARPLPGPAGCTFAVIGVLADKDAGAIAAALGPVIDQWIACTLPGPRGGSAAVLAQRLGLKDGTVQLADSVRAGCERARASARPGDRVVVCGSLHTVGPALEWLRIYW